jgi:hypothetical protein
MTNIRGRAGVVAFILGASVTEASAQPTLVVPPKPTPSLTEATTDECGAPTLAVRGLGSLVTYSGSGQGAIVDVTDWQPRSAVPLAGEIVIKGRNMLPNVTVMIGSTVLAPTSKSASEARFKVPFTPTSGALAIYHQGGQVRTLEPSYAVADPTVTIAKVIPSSFSPGKRVTVCGSSLGNALLAKRLQASVTATTSTMTDVVEIGTDSLFVPATNVEVSPSGHKLTFVVGQSLLRGYLPDTRGISSIIVPATATGSQPPPAEATGVLRVATRNAKQLTASGPRVTWSLADRSPPVVTKVVGRFFGRDEPFVILRSPGMSTGQFSSLLVRGESLSGATITLGGVAASSQGSLAADGTSVVAFLPDNASSGPLCVAKNGDQACSSTATPAFGGPAVTKAPTGPLAQRVPLTIEGTNLLPPSSVTGLSYQLVVNQLQAGGSNDTCNRVAQVLEHTNQRIVFRIGDPAKPAAANCNTGPLFSGGQENRIVLFATYANQSNGLWSVPYVLKP